MYQNQGELAPDERARLAGDMELFRAVESGSADRLYRTWYAWRPVVVAGRHRRVDRDVNEDACRDDGIPVVTRDSGGGTVILGAGCLNYALALSLVSRPALNDVALSFRLILDGIATGLGVPGLGRCETDLALAGRKVGGSAQRRGRRALLHHGTLLFHFDPALAERYLREPDRQPAWRQGRCHRDFLGNIPLAAEELRTRLERVLSRTWRRA